VQNTALKIVYCLQEQMMQDQKSSFAEKKNSQQNTFIFRNSYVKFSMGRQHKEGFQWSPSQFVWAVKKLKILVMLHEHEGRLRNISAKD